MTRFAWALVIVVAFVGGMVSYPTIQGFAAEADIYWLGGTSSTGAPIFIPASSSNPVPTSCH